MAITSVQDVQPSSKDKQNFLGEGPFTEEAKDILAEGRLILRKGYESLVDCPIPDPSFSKYWDLWTALERLTNLHQRLCALMEVDSRVDIERPLTRKGRVPYVLDRLLKDRDPKGLNVKSIVKGKKTFEI